MEEPLKAAKAKHTPGPWRYDGGYAHPDTAYSYFKIYADQPMEDVASIIKTEANARLIAAAPDLLEALKLFVAEYVQLVESGDAGFWDAEKEQKVIAARAAISQAEGGSP